VAALGPRDKEFAGWAQVAGGAATSARRGDLGSAKLACDTCHQKYKDAYLDKIVKHLPDVPDKH
ncbi:MAG TPA: hypothetical protein VIF62_02865, partial [Labilithrix sp.]